MRLNIFNGFNAKSMGYRKRINPSKEVVCKYYLWELTPENVLCKRYYL